MAFNEVVIPVAERVDMGTASICGDAIFVVAEQRRVQGH